VLLFFVLPVLGVLIHVTSLTTTPMYGPLALFDIALKTLTFGKSCTKEGEERVWGWLTGEVLQILNINRRNWYPHY